jgi:hypothetical protein
MRTSLAVATTTAVAVAVAVALAWSGDAQQPRAITPPSGWPASVVLGLSDPEGGASALRREAPLGLRYHYLSGGVNTGQGWQTFAGGGGSFVGDYVADSRANGFLTLFSYYMLEQSAPGNAQSDERLRTTVNLASRATMKAYFEDLRTFFQRAAATGGGPGVAPIVLHVEPDAWGYAQRSARDDDAATVPAQVAATGLPELAGLPDDVRGFAQAIVRLRDRYAPNVELGYHVSVWGTGEDISFSDPPDDHVDELARRTEAFYRSLGASFDLLFFEFADRDSGYREVVDGAGRTGWWDAADFHRNERYVGDVTSALQRPAVMWQIPLGNTRMRAMNNTTGHYQDNRVQTLLDPSRTELRRYRDAGIIAFVFGDAVPGATCACDAAGDGVTNPAPIDGNTTASLSADDDGGLFKQLVRQYAANGPLAATSGLRPPAFSAIVGVRPPQARRGGLVRVSTSLTSATKRHAAVSVEIRGPGTGGHLALRRRWPSRAFVPGTQRSFALSWRVPAKATPGSYAAIVRAGSFRAVASFTVRG